MAGRSVARSVTMATHTFHPLQPVPNSLSHNVFSHASSAHQLWPDGDRRPQSDAATSTDIRQFKRACVIPIVSLDLEHRLLSPSSRISDGFARSDSSVYNYCYHRHVARKQYFGDTRDYSHLTHYFTIPPSWRLGLMLSWMTTLHLMYILVKRRRRWQLKESSSSWVAWTNRSASLQHSFNAPLILFSCLLPPCLHLLLNADFHPQHPRPFQSFVSAQVQARLTNTQELCRRKVSKR